MDEDAEPILMGSAFEQLLNGDGSSYKLGREFGMLMKECGSVTVADAQKVRPDIQIDQDPKYANIQPGWWVHRKWIEELYDLRSKVVHEGRGGSTRKWAWAPNEHLVMAAFVFPLAVKLLLVAEGHYTLSDADKTRCAAIDKLLAVTSWDEDDRNTNDGPKWHQVVFKAKLDGDFDKRSAEFLKKNPDFLTNMKGNAEEKSGM